ncbi:MAG: transposase [Acidobacteria bacterium]|nr:transposase [Acidobacteriota bacterium]
MTEQRTMLDFAEQMKWLVDAAFPEAARVRVVMDNLNTHKAASLYERFAPEEARRILRKLEFHYMPKHGSWLNMAEIELSVLSRQCLDRRIGEEETLTREIRQWKEARSTCGRPCSKTSSASGRSGQSFTPRATAPRSCVCQSGRRSKTASRTKSSGSSKSWPTTLTTPAST